MATRTDAKSSPLSSTRLALGARRRAEVDNRRKFPRVDADVAGVLVASSAATTHAPIRVVCVSPGGIRFDIADTVADRCATGAHVVVRFGSVSLPFELPGEVVWLRRGDERALVGVALRLELAGSLERLGFAHWVVGRLSRKSR